MADKEAEENSFILFVKNRGLFEKNFGCILKTYGFFSPTHIYWPPSKIIRQCKEEIKLTYQRQNSQHQGTAIGSTNNDWKIFFKWIQGVTELA